jgi:MFS family permease
MPFNIDAIVRSFAATNTQAGLVASAEMGAIAAGNLLFARLAPRLNPRQVYGVGVLVIVALNVASVFVTSPATLLACRAPAGVALGAVVATAMATAGRSRNPEFTFGVINSAVGVMGMFIAYVLPRALNMKLVLPEGPAWSEVDGLYVVYALCSVCALVFIRGVPVPARVVVDRTHGPDSSLLIGWLSLLGIGFIFFGHATLALFIVKIGRDVPLTPEVIGYVFMAGSLVGIAAPLLAGYLGSRMPAVWPIAVLLVVLAMTALGLASASTPLRFYLTAPLFAMLPIAIMPIFLGALARLDPSGSLTGAHPAFVLVGGALAPFAGGALSDLGGFMVNGWFVAGCVALGAMLGFPALRQADRQRSVQLPVAATATGAVSGAPHGR